MRELQVLVVYYSRFGVLRLLAERVADGERRVGDVEVRLLEVADEPVEQLRPGETADDMARRRAVVLDQLAGAHALVVGAPAYFGSMASPVKRLFEECLVARPLGEEHRSRPYRHLSFRDKVGAAFTASDTPHGGNEHALHSILTLFMHLGMVVVTPGQGEPILENAAAPYGATAIVGPGGDRVSSAAEQDEARAVGERAALLATWLRLGRTEWEKLRERTQPERVQRGLDSLP